jgi:hypothetical protein
MQEQPVTTTAVCEADRHGRAAGQLVTTTALCEAGRCRACPGRIVSATPAHGQPCTHDCHTPEPDPLPEVA